jgi:ribose transport system substrate-binding protein
LGQLVADWLIHAKPAGANILELEGSAGSSPAVGRKKGFDAQIAGKPAMKILESEVADFDRTKGYSVAKAMLLKYPIADVFFAHNDDMALGALDALTESGRKPGKDVTVVSIDGVKEAIQDIIDGKIAATAFNDPRVGAIIFQTFEKFLAGQPIPPRIVVKGPLIDSSNAASMLSEAY